MLEKPTFAEYVREHRDYLDNPSYSHPRYGTPLQEPFKDSNGPSVVTLDGKPVLLPHERQKQ